MPNPSCGFCDSPTDSASVPCAKCGTNFHPASKWTGLSEAAIKCLLEEAGSGIQYVCTRCRCTGPASPTTDGPSAQGAMGQLYYLIKSLSDTVSKLSVEVAEISIEVATKRKATTFPGNVLPSRDALFSEFREFEERKKRADSLIVRGLAGLTDAQFKTKFRDISRDLVGSCVDFSDVYCINREKGLFRVRTKDRKMRQTVLQNANKLKGHQSYGAVFISRDLTYIQRQEMRQRREASRRVPMRRPPGFTLGMGQAPSTLSRGFAPTIGEAASVNDVMDHILSGAPSPEDLRSFPGF